MSAEQQDAASSGGSGFPRAQTVRDLVANVAVVKERMAAAADRAGRSRGEVRLLPVSKTVGEERIRLAVQAGCTELGENTVQEARRKHHNLADLTIGWSIIGHLQTNKANKVTTFAAEFQALDRLRVAEALDRRLQSVGRGLNVWVQVNTSGEESKYGLPPGETLDFLQTLRQFTALQVQGLMTLAVFSTDTGQLRRCFTRLRRLRDQARDLDPDMVGPGGLSMGMSGDYQTAIEEGATCVRVGQAIFGPRPLPDSHYWPDTTR